jgi:hypothetical protein
VAKSIEMVVGGTLKLAMREIEEDPICFVTLKFGSITIRARGADMAYNLPAGMQIQVAVSYVDGAGNPATVDGDPTWSSSDPTLVTVIADPANAFEAVLRAVGPLGQAQVTVTADADLGEGIREILTLMDVAVVAGEAVAGAIAPVGEPVPIPPHVQPV